MKTVALLPVHPDLGQLGHPRRLTDTLGERTVLEHTLRRLAAVESVNEIALVFADAPSLDVPDSVADKPLRCLIDPALADAAVARRRRVRRAWSVHAWRGGFRGATVWDELTPLAPLSAAADRCEADAVLLAGPDWCVIDPSLCEALLARHREAPDAMPLCFSQAPPGLSGLAVSAKLLRDISQANRGFADILAYVPSRPTVDPISRDYNLAIPASVRATARRFIHDTPEAITRLRLLQENLEIPAFSTADARIITDATRQLERERPHHRFAQLPPIVELELTPRRVATGPITPQHHVALERPDLNLATLDTLAPDLAGRAVTLGGIGEPLLHPHWSRAVAACRKAGASAVALQTDLLTDDAQTPGSMADAILDADPDVVFVRLNAETAEVYERAMGVDRFASVLEALQALFTGRAERARTRGDTHAFPLIVPTLTKTTTTTPQMDQFFERWWQLADHTVIHRFPQAGRGEHALADDQNPVPMDPPWRDPDPHQSKQRLTVLGDGRVCLCHEDWLGRAAIGTVAAAPLHELWQRVPDFALPDHWQHDNSPCCPRCFGFASLHARRPEAATIA